jgi:hypothetical protein
VTALLLAAGTAHASPRSLAACVTQWNAATYGNGKLEANAIAADGNRATLFAAPDGVCVLAFPKGVLVSGLSGDYRLDQNPLGRPVTAAATRLQRVAALRPNVTVTLGSGRVRARTTGAAPLTAGVVSAEPCIRTTPPPDADGHHLSFDIAPTAVPCATVRTVLWAWAAKPAPSATILGWTCIGQDAQPTPQPPYAAVTCTDGAARFGATLRAPQTSSTVGP